MTPIGLTDKDHIVTIAGLNAGTKYFYNVGTQTNGVQAGPSVIQIPNNTSLSRRLPLVRP